MKVVRKMATGGVGISSCSICLEPFRGRRPKLLPCYHTYCTPCLTRLADREKEKALQLVQTEARGGQLLSGEGDAPTISISCPTCRRVIAVPPGGVTSFQGNFYLLDCNKEVDTCPVLSSDKEDNTRPVMSSDKEDNIRPVLSSDKENTRPVMYSDKEDNTRPVMYSDKEDNSRPVMCAFCNEEEEAQYYCSLCQHKFCYYCRHYHGSVCQGGQITALPDPSTAVKTGSTVQDTDSSQFQQQLKMVQDCLKKLTEDKDTLAQEKEAMKNSVLLRYGSLLGHVSEAHNTCLTNLTQVCDSMAERLDTHMTEAQQTADIFQRQLSRSQPAPTSQAQMRAVQFVQGELQSLLNSPSGCVAALLRHEVKDNRPLLADCLQDFMGTMVQCRQRPGSVHSAEDTTAQDRSDQDGRTPQDHSEQDGRTPQDHSEQDGRTPQDHSEQDGRTPQDRFDQDGRTPQDHSEQDGRTPQDHSEQDGRTPQDRFDQGAMSSADPATSSLPVPDTKSWNDLCQKVDSLASQVSSLQSANSQLSQHVTVLSNTNTTLSSEQSNLQRKMTALQDTNMKLTSDQAILQREVTALKDKSVIVHQDLAVLTAEKDTLRADLAKLQREVVAVQTENSQLQSHMAQLKADHSSVATSISNVQGAVISLQGDSGTMKKDIDQLKVGCTALKSDVSTAQSSVSDLKTGHFTLQADLKAAKDQVVSLERKVKSAQDSLQDRSRKIAALESRFATANTQVAFHAKLEEDVTIRRKQRTLILRDVVSNVGSGYNARTGMFTAPLSGTYCFMATTGPNTPDELKEARLDIVLEDSAIGYMCTSGTKTSTGHTAVEMTAGQRVCLRTFSDDIYTFSGRSWTSFTGMLLQPVV